jgi:hypothetical protein
MTTTTRKRLQLRTNQLIGLKLHAKYLHETTQSLIVLTGMPGYEAELSREYYESQLWEHLREAAIEAGYDLVVRTARPELEDAE